MIRPLRVAALFAVLATPLFARDPWDAPAFSTEPAALIAAAEKVPAGDAAMVVLLDEGSYTFETDGRMRSVSRHMVRVVDESAIDDVGTLAIGWAPWYYDRPTIAARVVSKDGTVHTLDPKAITESPALDELDIFSDNRVLRAPLPGVAVGSVIETVITYEGKNPIAGAGSTNTFEIGDTVPTERSRLTIDAPSSMAVQLVNRSSLQPKVDEKDGRRVTLFESGHIDARKHDEGYLPSDVDNAPYIAFSTGSSWGDLATKYSAIVDKQIAGNDLAKFTKDAIGNATDRNEIIARALAAIQKNVRYAGVEVGESSIVPRAPRVVLSNKYGDCKDKATLLVAMLRQAGIAAHVALLSSGTGFDVIPDLPGLGRFNHAIVYVGDDAPLWVDPTDEFARAGELPNEDQGRMALVAAESTTALLRTPETPSAANRYTETRSYALPEEGKARVVEVSETTRGAEDAYQRRYYAGSDRTKYREQIENYVKSYYLAKKLDKLEASDPHDLSKPFRITIEASESDTGIVRNGDGAIALHPTNLVSWLPWALRESDEQRAKNADSQKRRNDFVFPAPAVHEWVYRITPPTGYRARTLPQNETKKLGTTTLTRAYAAQDDGTVVATLRFDSGKRRITAAEFEETRVAISKLLEEKQTNIGFDLIGQAKLNEGDVAGALAEFRKLAQLHPKESQHHIEIARALLAGGLGDAARAEIRRAVALEPSSAHAHLALAGILEHDMLGRLLRPGFDMDGALAALRKAKALDPKDVEIRSALAKLLGYGNDGIEFGRGAHIDEAIAEYHAAKKELEEKDARRFDADLMLALPFAGRFDEMKELAKTMEEGQVRETGRIVAIAATDGAAAALKELGAYDVNTRRTYAGAVGQTLIRLRLYPQAADILDSAVQGAPNASAARPYIDIVRKTKRLEDVKVDPSDPHSMMKDFFLAFGTGDKKPLAALFAPGLIGDDELDQVYTIVRAARASGEIPPAVLADLSYSGSTVQVDGNEKSGYRFRVRADAGAVQTLTIFATHENGRYVVRAMTGTSDLIGHAALRFADAGDLDSARIWLNWLREEVSAGGGGDDPLSGVAFAALWPKENAAADAAQIRLAAASLINEKGTDKALAALLAAREKATAEQTKWIDLAIAGASGKLKEWKTNIAAGERLFTAYPDSETAMVIYATGLSFGGRAAEAQTIVSKWLEKQPKNAPALRMLTSVAAKTHDYGAAARYAEQIIDKLTPTSEDYNNAAWFEMFAGDLAHALDNARRATNDDKATSAAALHTLATVYAETGKNVEARDALLRTLDRAQREQPSSSDWYVLGRLAENYGVADAALAAYKRVEDKEQDEGGGTVFELAQKRLAAMQKR
jgi:tetratricopeptide (TPR) repeat protein/transglutaminase-like putative cysteine protease